MLKFQFYKSNDNITTQVPFYGYAFYEVYKYAHFLEHRDNIDMILTQGHQLRQMLKKVEPGEKVVISGMQLAVNTPLLVKKGGPKISLSKHEFTINRLTGLTAAFVFDKRKRFPTITASESSVLGLSWNCSDTTTSRLYLSAVSGSEHFYDQFSYWPLVCALKKLELKKITLDPVVKIAKIKNKEGITMGVDMMKHIITTIKLWEKFTARSDFRRMIKKQPQELQQLLGTNY